MKKNYKYIDLHLHTTASDGTWTNDQLLKKLNEKNIHIFAITDHDSIENALKMQALCPDNMIQILGAEISATYENKEYHILAYGFDPSNQGIINLLRKNQEQRENYNQRLIKRIYETGYLENYDDFNQYTYDLKKGGFKSLNYLIHKKVIKDINDFFKLVSQFDERQVFPSPETVIQTIKSAGGYAFLAHPNAYFKGDLLSYRILDYFEEAGISGIECYSPYLKDISEASYYVEYCQKHQLMTSAGSDCHGDFLNRKLGNPLIAINQLDLDDLLVNL